MPFSNDLSVRKHAQNFLRQLDVKHLQNYKISSQKFSTLCAVRKDARLAATSILDKVKDGMPEDRAAELEAAHTRSALSSRIAFRLPLTVVTVIPSKIVLPILCAQAIRTEHGRNLA